MREYGRQTTLPLMFRRIQTSLYAASLALLALTFTTTSSAQCTADGGTIAFPNGATVTSIVVDGTGDPLDVTPAGDQVGSEAGWVITDLDGLILGLPPAPPFDLDPAGPGTCLIWHIRHDGTLTGAMMGNNASDLGGCFDLSNALTVERIAAGNVNGGNIAFPDGSTATTSCVDGIDDMIDVQLDGTATGENTGWVITDLNGTILGLPQAPPFNLDPAGPGTCLIWYIAWNGQLTGAMMGANAADLGGDFDLSNPVSVARAETNGGGLTFANGATEQTIVVDGTGDPLDVSLDGTAVGANRAWVITDLDGTILGLPPSPPFDLDGAGLGTCLIWYLAFEDGLTGAMMGANASDLEGCFSLSNPITVDRVSPDAVNGGNIAFPDGSTATTSCVDGIDDMIDVQLDGTATGENTGWVITDLNGTILGLPQAPPFNLDPAGPGTCLIWYIAWNGQLTGAMMGANAADLGGDFDLSNPVSVARAETNGGGLTFANGATEQTIVVDGTGDPLDVSLDGTAVGANRAWVITDLDGTILGLPPSPPFDLDGAGLGTCLIWYLAFEDGLTGAMMGANASDLEGCFSLSNPITVDRVAPNPSGSLATGNIAMPSGMTVRNTCPGDDIVIDVVLDYTTTTGELAYFLTDEKFNILSINDMPRVDLTGAPPGECYIFAVNYTGDLTVGAGDDFYDDDLSSGKDRVSRNRIEVVRNGVEGGTVQSQNGLTDVFVCTGDDDYVGFQADGEDVNEEYVYVITDDNNVILGINDRGFENFGRVFPGVCRVWGLSYTGDITAGAGDNAATAQLTDGCFDLSDNFITVTRAEEVDGGDIAAASGDDRATVTAANPVLEYGTSSTSAAPYAYFFLDRSQRIRVITFDESFDFSTLPEERYYIYGVSHQGNVLAEIGDRFWGLDITDACYDRSEGAIVVTNEAAGGQGCAAAAATLTPDNPDAELTGGTVALDASIASAANVPAGYESVYVLTTTDDLVILNTGNTPNFDVTEVGRYRIHSLVAELTDMSSPNFLDVSVIVPGQTTGGDVLGIVAANDICASLDPEGAVFDVVDDVPGFQAHTPGRRLVQLAQRDDMTQRVGELDADIRIIDALGNVQLVRTGLTLGQLDRMEFDLSGAQPGVYFVQISRNGGFETLRVVMQ